MSAVPIFSQRGRKPEPHSEIVRLTPDLAKKWLGQNNRNRNVRHRKVAEMARDMLAGNWQFNGDAIRFSISGAMLDGQHRCHAVVESGVTITVLVVWNLAEDAQDTMDIGSRRSLGDQLNLAGNKNGNALAAVLRKVVAWDAVGAPSLSRNFTPSFAEMRDYYDQHPEVDFAVAVAMKARRLPCAPSIIGALYYLCAAKNRTDAEVFYVEKLIDRIGLGRHDPVRALLRKLGTGDQRTAGETERRLREEDIVRYTLLAWNLFRDGREITKLQAPKGGWNGTFPEIK